MSMHVRSQSLRAAVHLLARHAEGAGILTPPHYLVTAAADGIAPVYGGVPGQPVLLPRYGIAARPARR